MPIRWTHITTKVSDLSRSIEFYHRFCGLALLKDRRNEGGSTVWLGYEPREGEDATFVIVLTQGEVTSRLEHLGFQCDTREQVDEIARQAEAEGILVQPPFDLGGSVGYFTIIQDPDGHQVEFTYGQPLKGLS